MFDQQFLEVIEKTDDGKNLVSVWKDLNQDELSRLYQEIYHEKVSTSLDFALMCRSIAAIIYCYQLKGAIEELRRLKEIGPAFYSKDKIIQLYESFSSYMETHYRFVDLYLLMSAVGRLDGLDYLDTKNLPRMKFTEHMNRYFTRTEVKQT